MRGLGNRAGVALAVVVLVSLALVLLAHAALLLADTEALLLRYELRRLEDGARRRGALRLLAADADSLPDAGVHGTPLGDVRVVRLSREVAQLRTRDEAGGVREGASRLLYSPDPGVRARDRVAHLRVGGTTFRAALPSTGSAPPDLCLDGTRDPLGGRPASPGPPPGPAAGTDPPWPGLGVLGVGPLAARLPLLPATGLVLPDHPPAEPACAEGGLPWGDPIRPPSPCGGRWGSGGTAGSLRVTGAGQGFLAVQGDLVLAPDADFRGWVVVAGRLHLGAGARFTGLADVGGDLVLEAGSSVLGDRCAGARAAAAASVLRRPWALGPSGWPILLP